MNYDTISQNYDTISHSVTLFNKRFTHSCLSKLQPVPESKNKLQLSCRGVVYLYCHRVEQFGENIQKKQDSGHRNCSICLLSYSNLHLKSPFPKRHKRHSHKQTKRASSANDKFTDCVLEKNSSHMYIFLKSSFPKLDL